MLKTNHLIIKMLLFDNIQNHRQLKPNETQGPTRFQRTY